MEGRFSRDDLREAECEDLERLLVPSVSTLNLDVFSATCNGSKRTCQSIIVVAWQWLEWA